MRNFILLLIFSWATTQANTRHFAMPMETSKWEVSTSHLVCQLTHRIPDYGFATVTQESAERPHFVMTYYQGISNSPSAKLITLPPEWRKPDYGQILAKLKLKPGHHPIYLKDRLTRHILDHLLAGDLIRFSYQSDLSHGVRVDLLPVNFHKAYAKYIACVGDLIDFGYRHVAKSTFYFEKNNYELNAKYKHQLDRVRRYVKEDPTIKKVFIAGYTDSRGRHSYNNAVSQKRAEVVKKYLLEHGVPAEKLKTTWYGSSKVDANKKKKENLAQNRRVEVLLLKDEIKFIK